MFRVPDMMDIQDGPLGLFSEADRASLPHFDERHIKQVKEAASRAEELVSNHYKMSSSQWLRMRYDIKTLAQLNREEVLYGNPADLKKQEILYGPFAQVFRYEAKKTESALGSGTFDFYSICLQDHIILTNISRSPQYDLYPFILYVIAHELIHIVRFSKFLQIFNASPKERFAEEIRVHRRTREILGRHNPTGMQPVFDFYRKWTATTDEPLEKIV